MGLFGFIFAGNTENAGLRRLVSKIDEQLEGKGFTADEKLLPMRRSKLEHALTEEMARPLFRKANVDYQRRIVRGYWSLFRFQKDVDSGLRSIFDRESPNFLEWRLLSKLDSADDQLHAKAVREREAAREHLQKAGLWTLIPENERSIRAG